MKKIIRKLLLLANILIIIGMLATGYAGIFNPVIFPMFATMGYFFPMFAIANVVMIMVWVCVRRRMLIVPFTGFLLAYSPMMTYCPVHMAKDIPDGCLKVMTYNTWMFGISLENTSTMTQEERSRKIIQYIADSDCDIVCIQEALFNNSINNYLDSIAKPVTPYIDTCYGQGGTCVMLLSKHPIKRHELIEYKSVGNLSAAFFLDINGKEVIVINNHLETNHFSTEEKEQFHTMVKGGMEKQDIKNESGFILHKLGDAAVLRAPQAEAVAQYIRMHKGVPMIVCGDFNDIPLSYAHRTIARDLTDCHTATANGPGFSYRKNGMYVRIDNIMCSDEFTPFECHVDKNIDISDHFPVISLIK